MQTGQVNVKGPFPREEKIKWDKLRERKHTGMDAIRELQDMVDDPENASIRKQIEAEIEFEQKLYDKINTVIKD